MGPVAGHAKRGPMNRKIAKRLGRCINDYERVNASGKKPAGSIHRPGSTQK